MAKLFKPYEDLKRAFEQIRLLIEPAEKASRLSSDMLEPLREVREHIMRIVSPHQKVTEDLHRQWATWQKLMQPNQDIANQLGLTRLKIPEASLAWDCSIAQTVHQLQEVGLFTRKEDLSLRLLEPFRIYTEFVEQTVRRVEQNENEKVTKALRASLYLAERQLLATSKALSAIVATPIDDEPVSGVRSLTALVVQQDELLSVADDIGDEEDEASLNQLSPAGCTVDDARIVLSLIVQCNEAGKTSGRPEIFKPTTRLLEASVDLPWLVPVDKRTLADFVDCLYFIFYEGAGEDNLRFLNTSGGVLDKAECDFIWCVKHLRNKWLRHDADHGREAAIRKSWEELATKFSWLGLGHVPISPEHFRHLHSRLLEEAKVFLQKILDKLMND